MLIRQTILYLPAQVIAPLVQFGSIIIWTHLMSPEDLGIVTLIVSIQEVCVAGFFGWWQRYVLRFLRSFDGDANRTKFLQTETAAILMSVSAQMLITTPLIIWQSKTGGGILLTTLIILFMVSRSISNYIADRARAVENIALYSFIQICGPVLGFVIGVPFLLHYGSSPVGVFLGFIVAQVAGLLVAGVATDFLRGRPRLDREIFITAFRFGGAVMLATLLATIALNIPRFIVSASVGLAAVGMFSVGYSLGMRASSFAVSLVTAGAYPLVVKRMQQEGKDAAFEQLSKNMILVAVTVAPVAFGLASINKSVIQVLIAKEFREASYYILPLSTMAGLFRYLRAHTFDQVFLVCLKPGYATAIAVVDIFVATVSAYLGLRWFGLAGAALGPMISGLATFSASFVIARMRFGFIIPYVSFLRIFLASAVMGAGVWSMPVAHNALWMVFQISVGGLIYVAALFCLMPKEREFILAILAKKMKRSIA